MKEQTEINDDKIAKKVLKAELEGNRPRGRPWIRWIENLRNCSVTTLTIGVI